MGLFDLFKGKKKRAPDPLHDLSLSNLQPGYYVDYDLKRGRSSRTTDMTGARATFPTSGSSRTEKARSSTWKRNPTTRTTGA